MKKEMMNNKSSSVVSLAITGSLLAVTIVSGSVLSETTVFADNDSVVDDVSIVVPTACTLSGTGNTTHNATINPGQYQADIGTTTLKALCNDSAGFAIYAAGYTGNTVGDTNSNKLIGQNTNELIPTGIGTSGDSQWAMKLATDSEATYPITIGSAPNTSGGADASFSSYHIVPNEYTKVAYRTEGTDVGNNATGSILTTTYAVNVASTQAADTYSGKVIYTLVHPATAVPVPEGKVGVNYNGNGKTFTGGASVNNVVYATSPMYIATTPQIAKSSNVANDGTKTTAYASDANDLIPITASGASKMKVVITYGVSNGTGLAIAEGNWDGQSMPDIIISQDENSSGTETYVFNGDTVTFNLNNFSGSTPVTDYDYGFWAQVYPIYTTEQSGTEATDEFASLTVDTGTYATTTDWYGSWYADINNTHYDFLNESEVMTFLENNIASLSGTTIDVYRGLTFTEAYTRASKAQDGGYYKQHELTKSMCNTIAITQNQTLKDIRDDNTYMVGKLKDSNCWMLDNLALDPTDSTTAANMNENNTNATSVAINNLLNGGSSTTGWSNTAVADVDSGFNSYTAPMVNNASKDTLVTSYGPASINGQAKVGLYYNYCAASAGTYCYAGDQGVDVPDTDIDASQDICPANWRMPTGGYNGEYMALAQKYTTTTDATNSASLQYNLSTPLSGDYYGSSVLNQGNWGYWWSTTYDGEYDMYNLNVDPTNVYPGNRSSRNSGDSIRCLVDE